MSSAILDQTDIAICPSPDSVELDSNNSYVNQDITLLVAEFEQLKGNFELRLTNVLVKLSNGQIQTIDLQWSKQLSSYLMLVSQEWAEQSAPVQFWPIADSSYWVNAPAQSVYEFGNCSELEELPQNLDISKVLSEAVALEEPPAYCSTCNDYFPFGAACQHIYFCAECNRVVTPSNQCSHQESQRTAPKWAA